MNSTIHSKASVVEGEPPLKRILFRSTETLFHKVALLPSLRTQIRPGQTPLQLLDELLLANQLPHAITVLAHALPGREALLWCCLTIEELTPAPMAPAERLLFEHCVRWIMHTTEALRHRAVLAEDSLNKTAISSVSKAIQAAGAQVEAEQQPKASAALHEQLARLVIEAIHRVTLLGKPRHVMTRQSCAIAIGIGVARGIYRFAK
jgi:hypothetical protein